MAIQMSQVKNPNADISASITDEQKKQLFDELMKMASKSGNYDASVANTKPKAEMDSASLMKDLIAKGAAQSIIKGQDLQIQEAMAQGMPPDAVLKQVLSTVNPQPEQSSVVAGLADASAMAQSPVGGAPAQDPYVQMASDVLARKPEQQKTTPFGILKDILTLGTASKREQSADINQNIDRQTAELANIQKAQLIAGQEPLQKGEKEKIGLEKTADLLKAIQTSSMGVEADRTKKKAELASVYVDNVINPKPMAKEAADVISLAEPAMTSITELLDLAQYDRKSGSIGNKDFLNGLKQSKETRQLIMNRINNITNSLSRKESGAVIGEKELEWVKKLVAEPNTFLVDPKANIDRLLTIEKKMKTAVNLLRPNEGDKGVVNHLKSKGFTDDQIYTLKERGEF